MILSKFLGHNSYFEVTPSKQINKPNQHFLDQIGSKIKNTTTIEDILYEYTFEDILYKLEKEIGEGGISISLDLFIKSSNKAILLSNWEIFKSVSNPNNITFLGKSNQFGEDLISSIVKSYSTDAVIVTDRTGKTVFINKMFTSKTGYSLEEMIQKAW